MSEPKSAGELALILNVAITYSKQRFRLAVQSKARTNV